MELRTWIEIDSRALKRNYQTFRRWLGPSRLMAVVKSNAYGHDLLQFGQLVSRLGADWFGVDSVVEAVALRQSNIRQPILVLGYTRPENFPLAGKEKITLTISSWENLRRLVKQPVEWHLKLDTGMHRQGFLAPELPRLLRWLKNHPALGQKMTGVYTHFAAAKNPAFPLDTKQINNQFKNALARLRQAGLRPLAHGAATAAAILFPQTHYDLVRIGIGLYGLWPSAETAAAAGGRIKLQPALTWKTVIGEVKKLPAAGRVGYDLTETLPRSATLAVCPVGYWHGYPRLLSSVAQVLVRGQRAKVIGRISMDMITIDVSRIKNVAVGDEVVLLGAQGKNTIPAEELAMLSQTINYELITRLNPLIKRIYF